MIRIVPIALAIAASACGDSPTKPDTVVGQPFTLKVGATAFLPDSTRVKFDGVVSDSRCPIDAICVSAGDATIFVSLVSQDGTGAARELHTRPTGSQIWYRSYTIKLTELQPYPRSTAQNNPADYVATFVVSVR